MNKAGIARWAAPVTFVLVLFYWPVTRVLSLGFSGNWVASSFNQRTVDIVWFTVWQAVVSASLSVLLALPLAYTLFRRSIGGKRFLLSLMTVPFMLPTIVVGIAFTTLESLPTVAKIIAAHVFMNLAIAVRIIGAVWQQLDTSTEEAAVLDGSSRFRVFTSITFPQLRTSIGSAMAIIFLYCTASFGVIMVLGDAHTRTLETEIYISATQFLDLPRTSGLAILQTFITVSAFALAYRLSNGNFSLAEGTSTRRTVVAITRDRALTSVSAGIFITVICWPLARIIQKAFTFNDTLSLQNFQNLGTYGARNTLTISLAEAVFNSLRNLLIASTLAIVLGTFVSYLLSQFRFNNKSSVQTRLLDTFFQIPIGTSAVVLGFGYLVTFSSGIFPLRSCWLATPLVQSLLAIPLVIRILYPALSAVDLNIHETAQIDAASQRQTFRWIEYPLTRHAMKSALAFAALVSFGEFSSTSFLAYGDQATVPLVLYQLIAHPGVQNYGMAMAMSFLLIISALTLVYAVSSTSDRE